MDYSVESDFQLFLAFKSGNVRAYDALFNRYWKSLLLLATKILEDEHRAQDVLQEVFVSLYEKGSEREIENVKAYLYQAVKYQCFMQLRSGKISEEHLRRLRLVYSGNNVEDYMNANELEHALTQGIEALPHKCRQVFYLSRYEALSNKHIAEQLNISQKTVEHQITKALKTLRMTVDKMALLAFLTIF